jgi:hypothetical protein
MGGQGALEERCKSTNSWTAAGIQLTDWRTSLNASRTTLTTTNRMPTFMSAAASTVTGLVPVVENCSRYPYPRPDWRESSCLVSAFRLMYSPLPPSTCDTWWSRLYRPVLVVSMG